MLIEFSVSNYASFRDRQTFSMVAAPRLRRKDCVIDVKIEGEKVLALLKVAAIYGPNATGKSSLLRALEMARKILQFSPSSTSRKLPVSPFRFDPALSSEPSRFEYNFIQNGKRYFFEIAVTQQRIIYEKLVISIRGTEHVLYERKYDLDNGDIYFFGPKLEGEEGIHKIWADVTGPQTLFIGQAVANSNEHLRQLRDPLDWLSQGLSVIDDDLEKWARITHSVMAKNPAMTARSAKFLKDLDVPVTKIEVDQETSLDFEDANIKSEAIEKAMNMAKKTLFTHSTALGEAIFSFDEESKGTRNLLGFFLPWSVVSRTNHVLIVDELDSSLHPKIVSSLLKNHISGNGQGQLIFTTHDTHLMDTKLLRRDQFWITERDVNGATQLRSIHDFEGREGEDIEKRYYEGRYRGLPILPTE